MSGEWMSPQEAAKYLGLSAGTLQNYRTKGALAKGRGPRFEKVPAVIRYRKSDLDEWNSEVRSKSAGWGGRRFGGRK